MRGRDQSFITHANIGGSYSPLHDVRSPAFIGLGSQLAASLERRLTNWDKNLTSRDIPPTMSSATRFEPLKPAGRPKFGASTAGARRNAPMAYAESDLRAAATAGLLEDAQLAPLLEFLHARGASATGDAAPAPRFDVAHLLWYAGALIVISAMGLFSTLAFAQMGGKALATTALIYAAAF